MYKELTIADIPPDVCARHVPCCAVKSCPLVTAIYWPDFWTFTLSHLTPSVMGILSSYRVNIWCKKTRMVGLQSGKDHMMIDSVVWAQYIIVTDTQTDTHPRRRSKCRANALRRAAKT